jgi:hypothetical protein
MPTTFEEALALAGVTVPDHLIAQAEVPVISDQPQRQGDVSIWPIAWLPKGEHPSELELSLAMPIPDEGIAVVRGEATGNTHLLHGAGCRWLAKIGGVMLGALVVPEGTEALLIHTDEHGANAMGPGTYVMKGKREQQDEIRRVAD